MRKDTELKYHIYQILSNVHILKSHHTKKVLFFLFKYARDFSEQVHKTKKTSVP
jgi:hypothetical protein